MSNYTVISPPSCTPSAPLVNTLSLLHYGRASIRRGKSDGYVGGGAATRERGGDSSSSSSRERARERENTSERGGGGKQKRGAKIKKYKDASREKWRKSVKARNLFCGATSRRREEIRVYPASPSTHTLTSILSISSPHGCHSLFPQSSRIP